MMALVIQFIVCRLCCWLVVPHDVESKPGSSGSLTLINLNRQDNSKNPDDSSAARPSGVLFIILFRQDFLEQLQKDLKDNGHAGRQFI